jgi:hypothetical protein
MGYVFHSKPGTSGGGGGITSGGGGGGGDNNNVDWQALIQE